MIESSLAFTLLADLLVQAFGELSECLGGATELSVFDLDLREAIGQLADEPSTFVISHTAAVRA